MQISLLTRFAVRNTTLLSDKNKRLTKIGFPHSVSPYTFSYLDVLAIIL
jgi:hypothetical protein